MKYSILIPTRNGITYLPYCVNSVINQNYNDFELIISDNHSTDKTQEYLSTLEQKNIKTIKPEKPLSMTDHWDWLLSHASGEWVVILGDDDGLQPYFFQLADFLTKKADQRQIRVVNSKQATFIWKGCKAVYGNNAVSYFAFPTYNFRNGNLESLLTLLGFKSYPSLPEMYTSSLFKLDLIKEVRSLQNGRFYTSVTPDANGAAIACNFEKWYLDTEIPLSWAGASPKSTGFASSIHFGTAIKNKKSEEMLRTKDYLALNSNSMVRWNEKAGDICLMSNSLFYWESLLQTQKIQSKFMKKLYESKILMMFIFGSVLYSKCKIKEVNKLQIKKLHECIILNGCTIRKVSFCKYVLSFLYKCQYFFKKINSVILKFNPSLKCVVRWKDDLEMNLNDASKMVIVLEQKHGVIKKFISKERRK